MPDAPFFNLQPSATMHPMRNLDNDITAYILADEFETPAASVAADRPLALAEVLGRPWPYHTLDRLADCGLRRVVFAGRAELPLRPLGDDYRGMALSFVPVDKALGSGGALRLALERHPASRALVLNGAILVEADLPAFIDWFATRREDGALLPSGDAARHGRVAVDETGRVTGFTASEPGGPGLGRVEVCLLRSEGLAGFWPEASIASISLERDVLPGLAAAGRLCALETRARFLDMTAPGAPAMAGRFLSRRENAVDGVAVFLDRDGTLIEEKHYLHDPAEVELLPGVATGLRRLRELGCLLVLVSNQSGVGRGYFDRGDVERVHGRLIELLASRGAALDAFYVCPHAPDEHCDCRKPLPGLVERACREIGLDAGRSFVIGDKPCDVELARAAGAEGILVLTGYGAGHEAEARARGARVARDLDEAAEIVARLRTGSR